MGQDAAPGQGFGDAALDFFTDVVAALDGPGARHEDVHLDETARTGGARAEAVDDDAPRVETFEEARERGLVVCAIGGNIVTAWSWFGVNMLGIGLHSYGFTDAAFRWLMLFVGSQIALILLGLLPVKMWKSFSARV